MAISDREYNEAAGRGRALAEAGHAVDARYDRRRQRVVIKLHTGMELTFPARLAEGLAGASDDALSLIEISPSGLGLHWPRLDADLYIPGLLQGIYGSRRWMAQEFGAAGGRARSKAKTAAARKNGKLGGRPRKHASA